MKIVRYEMRARAPPLCRVELDAPALAADDVLVEVAGCGVCHTDLGFLHGAVRTNHPLPLTLGHEVSGRVVAAGGPGGEPWIGRAVIVPAVIPCGACALCLKGRGSICRRQVFLGNDIHGGFASHVAVPARGLCHVPGWEPGRPVGAAKIELADLAVLADAFTTAYQAVVRSGLAKGDLAIFVGAGGVGGFGVQIAAALGATVAAIDVDPARLERLRPHGASLTLGARDADAKGIRRSIRDFAGERGLPETEWKIFETSGTPAGQDLAFRLLTYGAHLSVVGYAPADVAVRLSNLMAFDATASGNWGCLPERYPEALALVLDGRVALGPFVERRPLSTIQQVLEEFHAGKISRRAVLVPDAAATPGRS
ncbi:MAG: 6-hydroxycyclohex-1-ene-1-carbonyl-CoA dehydrogenase [Acidobacteria bacterium]|nr:6-hydroxycyclohex-1-ene-1-carbonyl-CoA dehydrogenase [Acidobacteriota bacterium]